MEFLNNLVTITGIFSFLFAIAQHLYYNKINVYIWINKLFKSRKDVNFEISLVAKDTVENLNNMLSKMRENVKLQSTIVTKAENRIVFSIDTMIIELRNDNIPDDEYHFEILVKNTNSSYAMARKNLKQLDKMFEVIIKEFNLQEIKYSFKSIFPKNNPFIGSAVTQIGVDKIKRFYMILSSDAFKLNAGVDSNIQINLNEISFVDNSFREVRDVAEIILAI